MSEQQLSERFWAKVDKTETCWLWIGHINADGYGRVRTGGKVVQAHRVSYETANGPIPAGLTIDHLCNTRSCVRPVHLEAVTHQENTRRAAERRTHCPNGHPYAETRVSDYRGSTCCIECRRNAAAAYMRRRRAAQKESA